MSPPAAVLVSVAAASTCGHCQAILVPAEPPSAGDYAHCPKCGELSLFRADGSLKPVGGTLPLDHEIVGADHSELPG